ncbi:MAG: hypothetical protein AAFX06_08330 [Planctomycetota bacterium]
MTQCPPVLILGFNRPDSVRRLVESILPAKPGAVFAMIDGPREDRQDEATKCASSLEAVEAADWQCPVHAQLREKNLGCQRSVSQAIDWFFQNVPEGIILEDDCLADPSFFRFCGELLDRYRDHDSVGCITGDNFQRGRSVTRDSYYFSRHAHCWGWATWANRWSVFDFEMNSTRQDHEIAKGMDCPVLETRYWCQKFAETRAGLTNSWAFRWTWSLWNHNLATITPDKNLVQNVGFGADATHTKFRKRVPEAESLEFPLRHPSEITLHKEADRFVGRQHFGATPLRPLRLLISKTLQTVRGR